MKYVNSIAAALILLAFNFCKNEQTQNLSVRNVDVTANINNMQIVNLSSFTGEIQYVPLETKTDISLHDNLRFDISEKFIVTADMESSLLLFGQSGEFILKFGQKGRGPEEYNSIENLTVEDNNKIYFSSLYDLFEFSSSGALVKKYPKLLSIDEKNLLKNWCLVDDTLLFGHIENNNGQTKYKAVLINKQGNIIRSYTNYDIIENQGSRINGGSTQVFQFEGNVYFKEQFTDTLFCLNDKYELNPTYSFSMGSLKMPVSTRCNFMEYFQKMNNYIAVENLFQTHNYILLKLNYGNSFPAHRLTSKPPLRPGGDPILTNTTCCLGIYNKSNEKLVFCKPTSTDNPLNTSGIFNDIDAGPRFFPEKMINDSTFVMTVSAKDLKYHIASEEFKNNSPKYPNRKKMLEEFANNLSEFDNPILMIVTFKK